MKYWTELSNLETQIIRLETMRSLFSVMASGAEESSAEDVRNALEGKLKPREDIIHLGRAVVRDSFKISRVGTIAGCYVTQGTIERSAKIRLIRNGVVIYPPPEKNVGLESLKRFKDDVREVREGFECGIKILNYDDIKVDDVIEAYKVEQVLRTLS